MPTGALERMLWLESDRMTHLLGAVDQATLDEQRSVVQNEKRQAENRPWGSVWDVAFRGLFSPGHPYQHPVIGSMEDLDAATLADVKDWFDTYYGASNVAIVLAGDIDVATARPLIEKYYADAPAGQPLTRIARWVPKLTENRHEVIYDQAASGFIRRSWAVPSTPRESVGFALWSSAFARGRTAPLYRALVEEHRLASFVTASPIDYELTGVFSIDIQLLPDADVEQARRILDETLAEFLVTGPGPRTPGAAAGAEPDGHHPQLRNRVLQGGGADHRRRLRERPGTIQGAARGGPGSDLRGPVGVGKRMADAPLP